MTQPTLAPAGWYADPHAPGQLRWYDGAAWTAHTAPTAPPNAYAPPSYGGHPYSAQQHGAYQYGPINGSGIPKTRDRAMEAIVPVNRAPLAILAGYLGLFCILIIPAPIAVIVSIVALRQLRSQPDVGGRGRAWFGLACGLLTIFAVVATALGG